MAIDCVSGGCQYGLPHACHCDRALACSPGRPRGRRRSSRRRSPLPEMTNKQAVVNTTAGTFVIDLRPDLAPNHVGYFMKLAQRGRLQRDDLPPRDQVRDRAGRRPAVEGSGEGEAVWHRRARRAEGASRAPRSRRAARCRRCCSPGGRTAPARSSSSASRTSRARRQVHGVRPRRPKAWTSCRRSPRRRRAPTACRPSGSRSSRSRSGTRRRRSRCRSRRHSRRSSRSTARRSTRPPARSRSSSSATRRPSTSGTSCGSRRPASTMAPPSIAS